MFSTKKRNILFGAAFFIFVLLAILFFGVPTVKKYNFHRFVKKIQSVPEMGNATLAIAAKYEGSDEYLVFFNGSKPIHPGSNYKLFTAAASLRYLSPQYVFHTPLFRLGSDLVLVGSGDPTIAKLDIEALAQALQKAPFPVKNILYDDRVFEGEKFGPDWDSDWFDQYFAVPITGLQMHDNLLEVRGLEDEKTKKFEITTIPLEDYKPLTMSLSYVDRPEDLKVPITAVMNKDGSVEVEGDNMVDLPFRTSAVVRDPSLLTASVLKQELLKKNLMKNSARILPFVGGKNTEALSGGTLVTEHISKPLSNIVFLMLKFSKNNYGETLVRTLGKEVKGKGTQAAGVEVLKEFFVEVGVPKKEVDVFDGSGLSKSTRVSSEAIIRLFDYVNQQPWKDVFWNALPESQLDGTLKYRFENAGLEHRVIAKTGTHLAASSLSGKIVRPNGNILFSIHIFNHPYSDDEIVTRVHPIIDKIVALLDKQF